MVFVGSGKMLTRTARRNLFLDAAVNHKFFLGSQPCSSSSSSSSEHDHGIVLAAAIQTAHPHEESLSKPSGEAEADLVEQKASWWSAPPLSYSYCKKATAWLALHAPPFFGVYAYEYLSEGIDSNSTDAQRRASKQKRKRRTIQSKVEIGLRRFAMNSTHTLLFI